MPVESHLNVIDGREGAWRCFGEELERHRGRVVGDANPVGAERGQVRETEEGLELAVFAELEVEDRGAGSVGGDGFVEGGEDLGGEGGAGDGADGVRGVVGEVELVGVGQGADLEEGRRVEEVGRRDGGVVDFGDVEVVEDCVGEILLRGFERKERIARGKGGLLW